MSTGMLLTDISSVLFERCGIQTKRSAEDVLHDLSDPSTEPRHGMMRAPAAMLTSNSKPKALPLDTFIVAAALSGVRLVFGLPSSSGIIVTLLMSLGAGYLAAQGLARQRAHRRVRELEFYLPIVMERIVMAVQAGHDILAGMRVVISLDEVAAEDNGDVQVDPVTQLLAEVLTLAESGLSVEQSLSEIALRVPCPAIRHAFIHLAQSHKEGGELVMPLRELSDATQLYYQETIEEEIAKMPVKATLPLLCTFAGLLIFFLTSPLLQVMEITTKAMPK